MDGPDPAPWQPPLHWYSHLWRDLCATGIGVALWIPVVEAQAAADPPVLFWSDIIGGVVCLVLIHWRRRWPMTIAVLTLLIYPFSSLSGGPALVATMSAATRRVRWQVITLAVLNVATALAYSPIQPTSTDDPLWLTALFVVAATAAIIGWGMFVGSRRELVWTLRQRAEAAEAERDVRAREARTHERARIAREMHDVLAHRISQISMHAGALSYREDLDADEMRVSAGVIREKAHEALTDLRDVLGVLRNEGAGDQTGPQPTYGDLPALLDDARTAGMTIEYDDQLPEGQPLPETVGRTTYRIVQEGITNARKHAPGARLCIRLRGSPDDGLDLTLRNPIGFTATDTPGAGLGLIGLAERTALRDGRLDHGVEATPSGPMFVLRVWLPWAT